MSKLTRKRHWIKTKIDVALEALTGLKTTTEITSKFGVHLELPLETGQLRQLN